MREYEFAGFEAGGFVPNQRMLDATGALIDAMDLMKGKDDDGEDMVCTS
mgnify:CR=1 FL=1